MKRALAGILITLFFLSMLFSQEISTADSLKNWLSKMQTKIQRLHKKTSSSTFVTVAGVRGAKQELSKNKIYWKGKKGTKRVSANELMLFETGINYAQNGEYQKALETLEKFIKTYPKSPLFADVQKTIALIKERQKF